MNYENYPTKLGYVQLMFLLSYNETFRLNKSSLQYFLIQLSRCSNS